MSRRTGRCCARSSATRSPSFTTRTYKDYWEIPGGAVDADESPYDAAVRELKEEPGLSVPPGRLLVVDWVPARPGRTEGVMFVYDGGLPDATMAAQIHVPPDESRS